MATSFLREQARSCYKNLSGEEKDKAAEYGRNLRSNNFDEDNQKPKECRKYKKDIT